MTGETVPSGREKCRLWILRHIKRDTVCPTHNKVTKTCTANRTVRDRDLEARSSRDKLISRNRNYRVNISIDSTYRWCANNNDRYQSGRIISVRQTWTRWERPTWRREIFIDPPANRTNRRNRFQHIRADKRYSRSGAKAQWAPDGFEIKTICKLGTRINRRVQSTRRPQEQLLGTNRWINSVRLAAQGVFSA